MLKFFKRLIDRISYYIIPKPVLCLTSDIGPGGIITGFGAEPVDCLLAEALEIPKEELSGANFMLELRWMTQYKRDRLPEFEGW